MHAHKNTTPHRNNRFLGSSEPRPYLRQVPKSVAKAYTKEDIILRFDALELVLGKGNVVIVGRSAEVMRGFFETTHVLQFMMKALQESSLGWLKENAISLRITEDPSKFCSITPSGILYHPAFLSDKSFEAVHHPIVDNGKAYLPFEANLEFWNSFPFFHEETGEHFRMTAAFMDDFGASESDLRLLIDMRDYLKTPVHQRVSGDLELILSKIKLQPQSEKWLEAFAA